MKKKNTWLQIESLQGNFLIFPNNYSSSSKLLKNIFTNAEILIIKKHFEKFYKLIMGVCSNDNTRQLLKNYRKELLNKYLQDITLIFSDDSLHCKLLKTDIVKNNKNNRINVIMMGITHLFFYADLMIAFVTGKEGEIKSKLERRDIMTGKKLSQKKKDYYLNILNKQKEMIDKEGVSNQKSSLTNAVRMSDMSLPERRIKSIAETIRYHQKIGNLPK